MCYNGCHICSDVAPLGLFTSQVIHTEECEVSPVQIHVDYLRCKQTQSCHISTSVPAAVARVAAENSTYNLDCTEILFKVVVNIDFRPV